MTRHGLLLLIFVLLPLGGCGLFSKDKAEPPAPVPSFEPVLQGKILWTRDTGTGVGRYFLRLHPFLRDGAIYIAGADGRVGAYRAEDGHAIWQRNIEASLTGGVGGGDGLVLVGSGAGDVIALHSADGSEAWRQRLTSEVMALGAIDRGVAVARTNDGRLYGLEAVTGAVLWQAGRTTPPLSLRGTSVPLVGDGGVIAGFDNGRVVAFALDRGNAVWEAAAGAPLGRSEIDRMTDVDGRMVVADGVLYAVAYQGSVVAVSVRDGRTLWSRELSSYAGLAVDETHVYVTDSFGHVWALDRASGGTLWQQDRLRLRGVTAPAVTSQGIVVADYEGHVYWLSPEDGGFLARARTGGSGPIVAPLVRGDVIHVLGRDGRLAALSAG